MAIIKLGPEFGLESHGFTYVNNFFDKYFICMKWLLYLMWCYGKWSECSVVCQCDMWCRVLGECNIFPNYRDVSYHGPQWPELGRCKPGCVCAGPPSLGPPEQLQLSWQCQCPHLTTDKHEAGTRDSQVVRGPRHGPGPGNRIGIGIPQYTPSIIPS